MAVGAAVILCNTEGLGGLVTPADADRLRRGQVGRPALTRPATADLIERELRSYDAAGAAAVRDTVRAELSREIALDRIIRIYERALADFPGPLAAEEERAAMHRHHRWHARAVRRRLLDPLREAESRLAAALERAERAERREASLSERVKAVESSLAWRLARAAGRLPGVLRLYRTLRGGAPAPAAGRARAAGARRTRPLRRDAPNLPAS